MTTIKENIELEKKELPNKEERGTNTETILPNEIEIYNKKRHNIWSDRRIYHDFCMVINYMIISATLLMLTYFLYNLTREIRDFDVANIANGIDSVNNNLYGINKFGETFTQQIEHFHGSDLQNFDINRLNTVIDSFINSGILDLDVDNFNKLINNINRTVFNFDIDKVNTIINRFTDSGLLEFDIDNLNQLVRQMNQTVFNLNNAIQTIQPGQISEQYIETATDISPPNPPKTSESPSATAAAAAAEAPTAPKIGF